MATALQNFREQYPQYDKLDDEELAEGIRKRYYADMDQTEYRKAIGLPPPLKEPEPPGIWDRVKSAFSTEADKPEAILSDKPTMAQEFADPEEPTPPEQPDVTVRKPGDGIQVPDPTLGDQLKAGWADYLGNRATAAKFDVIEDYRLVEDVALGKEEPRGAAGGPMGVSPGTIGKFARASRAQDGDKQAQRQIRREISNQRLDLTNKMQTLIDRGREYSERAAAVPYSESTQNMLEAEGFSKGMRKLGEDPVWIMAELVTRSLPNMIESIPLAVGGAMFAGAPGFAIGMGAGESMVEYRASFAEGLQKFGEVDLNSAESMLNAADDDALMRKVHNYAALRSGIIGFGGGISAGLSTRTLTPFVKNALGRELSNVAVQTAAQVGIAGTAELGAQAATLEEGEDLRWGEIIAEGAGDGGLAVIDVGLATVTGVRGSWADAKAARIESEVDEMLGGRKVGPEPPDEGPRGTPPEPVPPEPAPPEPAEPIAPPEEFVGPPTPWERLRRRGEPGEPMGPPREAMGPPEPMGPRAPEAEPAAPPTEAAATAERLRGVLEGFRPEQVKITAKDARLPRAAQQAKPELIDRLIMTREMSDMMRTFEGSLQKAVDAINDGRLPRETLFAWAKNVSPKNQWHSEIGTELNLSAINAWNGGQNFPTLEYDLGTYQEQKGREFVGPPRPEEPTAPQPPTAVPEDTAPPQYSDPRLMRNWYRGALQDMANDLTVGGGIAYTRDANDNIDGRTGSINPQWFQDFGEDPDYKMTVRQLQQAVNKAITGKRLGIKQLRVTQAMLDQVTEERLEQVDYAKQQLGEARERRRLAKEQAGIAPAPEDEFAGELFDEDEYLPDQDADSRIIFELMEQASELGVDVERLAIQFPEDNNQLIQQLEAAINERVSAIGPEAVAPEPEARPEAPPAPAPAPEPRKPTTAYQQDALEKARTLEQPFASMDLAGLPAPGKNKTITFQTISGLINKGYLRPINPDERLNDQQLVIVGEEPAGTPEADPLRASPAEHPAKTGQPFKAKLFHGSGRTDMENVYSSVPEPLLGRDVRYWAFDPDTAGNYGPNIDQQVVDLQNPLVIDSDEDFRAWHKRAGNPWYLNPFAQLDDPQAVAKVRGWAADMRAAAEDAGHDGVVLQWNPMEAGDIDPEGRVIKRLFQVWAEPQVIEFNPDYTQVEATTRHYNENQLELYLEQDPVPTQAGAPRLEPAKAAAVDALENLRSIPSVLAHRLRGGFADRQKTDLIGQVIETRLDLAVLAQVYRDPRFETLRIFFLDDTRQVVSQIGLTSRLPASSSALVGAEFNDYVEQLHAAAKTKGATGYYMMHNHPTGTSRPSEADESITFKFSKKMPGFLGHVVIDENNWSEISAAGQSQTHEMDLGAATYRPEGGVAGGVIRGPGDLVMLSNAYQLKNVLGVDNNDVVLVVADNHHRVQNVSLLPADKITTDLKRNRRQLLRAALANQGNRIFAIGRSEEHLRKLSKYVVDIILIDDQGKYSSQAEQGKLSTADDLFPRSRVARISPDTSAEFDYLKPFAMQERLGERAELAFKRGEPRAREPRIEVRQEDLFGGDKRKQELADEIRRKDEARNRGQEEVETGDMGDMFSQAVRQDELFDPRQRVERGPERRKKRREAHTERRKREMAGKTSAELVTDFFTDRQTGLNNRAAFNEEAADHNFLASIDVDSLKWVNDNLGHDAGDAMLKAMGEALDQTGIDAYHISGDEFYLGGDSVAELEGAIALAKGILDAQEITGEGRGVKRGVGFTAGIGPDKASADAQMEAGKKRRQESGERVRRGTDVPPGGVLSVRPPVLNAERGTNYVPLIGQTGRLPIDANHNLILGNGRAVKIPKKPIRREHIINIMRRYFGNRIYQGRVKGRNRLGFYRPGQGELRLKNHNDIEVAAHEIAHWLDDRNPWIARLYNKFPAEMVGVSYDVDDITEGYAEFMRLFFTQESEAMGRAPGFYDAFNKELAKQKKLQGMVFDLQEQMHAWTQQGVRARLASKMGFDNVRNGIMSFYDRARSYFGVSILQSGLDGVRAWKKIEQAVMGKGVTTAYEKIRVALGGSSGVLEATVYYGTPGWRADGQGLEFTGESLMDIFGTMWGEKDLGYYLIARRGAELYNQGRENLLRVDEIAAGLRLGDKYPEFVEMFERYQAYNKRILDFAQGAGILGAETREYIEEMNKSYVPFHRILESMITGNRVRMGGNPFQRLKGGTQNLNNVFDNIINNTGYIIRMAMINDAKRSLLGMLGGTDPLGAGRRNTLAGTFAAPISTDAKPVKIQSPQVIRKVLQTIGWTMTDYRAAKEGMIAGENIDEEIAKLKIVEDMINGLGEMVTFFQTGQDPSGFVDYYLEDGKKHWFEIIDPDLWDSMQYIGPKGANLLLSIFGGFSATLRRGVVAVPVFQLKNFLRDTVNAWLLSTDVYVPAARAMRVVLSRMNKDPDYREMLLNGGGFANRSQGLNTQRKMIIDPTRLTAKYDKFMGRFENANRLAEYKAAKKAGKPPRRRALLSRDISTDFAMRGSAALARILAISVPFLNARVQGLYRVARQTESKAQVASYAIKGMSLAAVTAALYALNKDDERYEELPEDVKDLYWVFFDGEGEDDYFLWPKPFESGMIWGTIPERIYELTEKQDGKEFADAMLWVMLETFNLDMTPQAFQVERDLQRNKKWTGAPILPLYLDNVEPSEQFQYYTSETVIEAAQKFGISPIKLEYRLRGYFGTLGTYAIAMSDSIYRAVTDPEERRFGEEPSLGESWRENWVTRYTLGRTVPGQGPMRRTKSLTDLYEMVRETEKVASTVALMSKRNNEEVELYLARPEIKILYDLHPELAESRKELGDIRRQMDVVRADKTLTGDEKRVQLWNLSRERNHFAREAMSGVRAALAEAEAQEPAAVAQ